MTDPLNNEQILREKLALERTRLANDRTLLAFIRTSLYFGIAGISINNLLVIRYGWLLESAFLIVSILLIIIWHNSIPKSENSFAGERETDRDPGLIPPPKTP